MGRLAATVMAGLLLAGCSVSITGGVVTTISEAPPPAGPPLQQVPANPDSVIRMLAGRGVNEIHQRFLAGLPDYVSGSGRVDAVYPGRDGDVYILSWQQSDSDFGPTRCRATGRPDMVPAGFGCFTGEGRIEPFSIAGVSYSTGDNGDQEVMIEHTRDAAAVVIETEDDVFVIIPGTTPVSYHAWNGDPPIRVTVFWNDGTSTVEALSP